MRSTLFSSLAIALLLAALPGCSREKLAPMREQAPIAQHDRANPTRQLAYEHFVDVDTAPAKVADPPLSRSVMH
jgi:hypothetical protein